MQHGQIWRAIDLIAARKGLTPSGLARAAGLDPIRRGGEHLEQLGVVPLAAALDHAVAHALARQGTVDEHRLAGIARDASPLAVEVHDLSLALIGRGATSGAAAAASP